MEEQLAKLIKVVEEYKGVSHESGLDRGTYKITFFDPETKKGICLYGEKEVYPRAEMFRVSSMKLKKLSQIEIEALERIERRFDSRRVSNDTSYYESDEVGEILLEPTHYQEFNQRFSRDNNPLLYEIKVKKVAEAMEVSTNGGILEILLM